MRLTSIFKIAALSGLLAMAGLASAQKTQLLVYTALETDQIKAYQEGFNKV
jgi:iron(III) transport system substrate-binding protein